MSSTFLLVNIVKKVVDWILSSTLFLLFGDWGLNKWIGFVNLLYRKRLILERTRYRLLFAPASIPGWVNLEFANGPFSYFLKPRDELFFTVRDQLQGWEEKTIELFTRVVASAQLVVDVGAYSGIFSLIALSQNSTCQIVAVEPNPVAFDILLRNISKNGFGERSTLLNQALGKVESTQNLFFPEGNPKFSSRASLNVVRQHSLPVKVSCLDNICQDLKIDVIKIDVEGGELEVLLGGLGTLKRCNPSIFIELLDSEALVSATNLLKEIGYQEPLLLDHSNYFFAPIAKGYL